MAILNADSYLAKATALCAAAAAAGCGTSPNREELAMQAFHDKGPAIMRLTVETKAGTVRDITLTQGNVDGTVGLCGRHWHFPRSNVGPHVATGHFLANAEVTPVNILNGREVKQACRDAGFYYSPPIHP